MGFLVYGSCTSGISPRSLTPSNGVGPSLDTSDGLPTERLKTPSLAFILRDWKTDSQLMEESNITESNIDDSGSKVPTDSFETVSGITISTNGTIKPCLAAHTPRTGSVMVLKVRSFNTETTSRKTGGVIYGQSCPCRLLPFMEFWLKLNYLDQSILVGNGIL